MELMSISPEGNTLWRVEYLVDGCSHYAFYTRRNYPDEMAVLKQFLWENSDDYQYRHY